MERTEYTWRLRGAGEQLSAHWGDLVAHVDIPGAVWKLLGEASSSMFRVELVKAGTWEADAVGEARESLRQIYFKPARANTKPSLPHHRPHRRRRKRRPRRRRRRKRRRRRRRLRHRGHRRLLILMRRRI